MSSTDAAPSAARPPRPARPPTPLTELLVLLAGAADAVQATIKHITVAEVTGSVYIEMATGGDVARFVENLGHPRIDVRHQDDVGVVITSYAGFHLGWSLYVQQIGPTPTSQEGTTPA